MFQNILNAYGLDEDQCLIQPFGSGLINHTWKVTASEAEYILQRINNKVFANPEAIDDNLNHIKIYLQQAFPEYLFPAPLSTLNGQTLVHKGEEYYRMLPFVKNSHTIDYVTSADQAYQAAKAFGKFTRVLNGFNAEKLTYTIPDFHNLSLRIEQFNKAIEKANEGRISLAKSEIEELVNHADIAEKYDEIKRSEAIPLRVIHHDTKISNVLLDDEDKGLCVIDLDTVMPGYFFSDVGDMMRTYLAESNEEEQDFKKVTVREEVFTAIYKGYMGEMAHILTPLEKDLFIYGGKFMIYMQALRFLTDFLNGDVYYPTTYPHHNLSRARNQIALLNQYILSEPNFIETINQLQQD
ncbi:aminoglycoside phosphotransferase family protein [Pedobacter yonginense]|uniref:Aminoglycoside phosphotransferase family protein n=2 Tax=Pedobacter yonginense TaxID=651869 RepID=A0A317EHY2_9SPHI|nr:aminoglycoside phosphotransferase family protein [Pedobacter yonginense]